MFQMFHQRNSLHVVNQKYNPLNILYFSKIKHSSTLTKTYMCYNWKQNAVICRVCGHDIRTQCISTQSSSDTWEGWHADIWVVVIMTPIQILGCYVHRKIKSTHAPELQNTLAAQHTVNNTGMTLKGWVWRYVQGRTVMSQTVSQGKARQGEEGRSLGMERLASGWQPSQQLQPPLAFRLGQRE